MPRYKGFSKQGVWVEHFPWSCHHLEYGTLPQQRVHILPSYTRAIIAETFKTFIKSFDLHQTKGHISSVECKKVVSAFSSFCRKDNYVLRFPFYFIVFRHLISPMYKQIFWVETYTIAQNVSFHLNFQYVWKTQFPSKCHLRPSCIHMTIYYSTLSSDLPLFRIR